MTSAFDIVELRWYFLFPVGFSVYFVIIASNNLQKSSAIQKISVVLSLVIIAIFVWNCLYINTLKSQQTPLITHFIDTYNSSNSRYIIEVTIFALFLREGMTLWHKNKPDRVAALPGLFYKEILLFLLFSLRQSTACNTFNPNSG